MSPGIYLGRAYEANHYTLPERGGDDGDIVQKGNGSPVFPFPMDEIRDTVVDGDVGRGSDFEELRERVLAEIVISQRFQLTEDFLLSQFRSNLKLNPASPSPSMK